MKPHRTLGLALSVSLLSLLLACSGGSDSAPGPKSASINVTLVDGPAPDYKEINVNIQKVEIHTSGNPGESGWLTLSEPKKTVDLLKLTHGIVEILTAGKTLDPGRYQQLRLVLGESGNTLKLADGSSVPLDIPSAQKTGIKIPLSFEVALGTTADIWIDFDGAHSIHVKAGGGPSQTYTLRPVIHAFEKIATGSASGTLAGPGGAPLAGALVTAQAVDGSGNVTILRSTVTAANGTYTLGLLPVGQAYFVVSQPVIGTTAYEAQASALQTPSAATPVAVVNFTFGAPATSVGGAAGNVSPLVNASQSDTILLLKSLATGASQTTLAVASVNAQVTSPQSESYAFAFIPGGSYRVQGLRATLNADGTTTLTRSALSPSFSINNGTTTFQNLSFTSPSSGLFLRVGGGPGSGFADLRVTVAKVEVEGPSGWIRFAEPNKAVNLVGSLSYGGTETLTISNDLVPPGPYSRVRVSFGSEIMASLGGEPAAFAIPEPVIVEAPLDFDETHQGLVLLFAPYRSFYLREGTYSFRPSLQVLQEGQIGRVQGRLTAGGQGLGFAEVIAQTLQEAGVPRLLQAVFTDASGYYTLDLLPKRVPLHVVALPPRFPTDFVPQASPSITLAEAPVEWNASFLSRPNSYTLLRGSFLPAAARYHSGEVHLLGPLPTGNDVKWFMLGMGFTGAGVISGASSESYSMYGNLTGPYALRAYRTTWSPDGTFNTLGQTSMEPGAVIDFSRVLDFHW
jgi:hypothetical protein